MNGKEKERLNRITHDLETRYKYRFTWKMAASATGWSTTTVRNNYDKEWYPGKYFQAPIKAVSQEQDTDYCGLYLLAQQVVIDGDVINLIKVGKSKKINQRMKSYYGMNPMAKCISTVEIPLNILDETEKKYHMILGSKNQRYGNTEWFICNDEEYNKWTHMKLI